MNRQFKQDAELDASLCFAAFTNPQDGKDGTKRFAEASVALGITDCNEVFERGLWLIHQPKEYQEAVRTRFKELLAQRKKEEPKTEPEKDNFGIPIPKGATRLAQRDPELGDMKNLGLDETPEIVEFVHQVANAAVKGEPLAKPFLDADVLRVVTRELSPGIFYTGVHVHQQKFAEMLKERPDLRNLN
jgi:hypothetical protein